MKKIIIMRRVLTVMLPVLALFISGCKDSLNYDELMADESRYFQIYMDANYPDLEPTASGLYYKVYTEGTGKSPKDGDYVLINFLAYTIPDETVVDTYTEEWARDYNLYNSSVLYGPYKLEHGSEIEGMKEGISMMKEGGVARFIFKSDLGYGAEEIGSIGKFESLMYDIELVEVIGDAEKREQEQIDAYLLENPGAISITDDKTEATMYYYLDEIGDSTQIENKSKVEVYYTGQLLDGRVFDSNIGNTSGMSVTIGKEDVISGWELGLKFFKYGGKGRLLIPHELAYGAEGSTVNNTKKTAVPPYEALLFDIELTKKVIK